MEFKQRILGDRGHLSNEDGALVMTDVIGNRTKRIYLGHLSKENNMKELAHLTMENVLKEKILALDMILKSMIQIQMKQLSYFRFKQFNQ